MKKSTLNYIVVIILFVLLTAIVFIGILMGFFIPKGPTVNEADKYLWQLHRHQWGDIHLYLSLVFIAFIITHIILHWNWIKDKTRKLFGKTWVVIFILILPALLIFLLWFFYPKNPEGYRGYGKKYGQDYRQINTANYIKISGRMTLYDIQEKTGIPAKKIIERLGLPEDVPLTERLGKLRKKHSFSMQKIRNVIYALIEEEGEK